MVVRGGSTPHRIDPPLTTKIWAFLVLRGQYPAIGTRKADRALQYTIIKRLGPMSDPYPLEKKSRIWWSGGGRRDPPLTTEFQVVRVR